VWAISPSKEGAAIAAVTFNIPLKKPLNAGHAHFVTKTEWSEGSGPEVEKCPGTTENPTAEPGNLCVYAQLGDEGIAISAAGPELFKETGTVGTAGTALLDISKSPGEELSGAGTWAVTAE
jgi:hypothetical protein